MLAVFPDQDVPKFKYSHTTCRAFVQPPLDTNGVYDIIENKIINTPHDVLLTYRLCRMG